MAKTVEKKTVYLKSVEGDTMTDYVERIKRIGKVFSGTVEEFEHYRSLQNNAFYEVNFGPPDFRVVGAICKVFNGTRGIVSGIALDESGDIRKETCRLTPEDILKLSGVPCVNYPSGMVITDLRREEKLGNIFEFSVKCCDLKNSKGTPPNVSDSFVIHYAHNEGDIEKIVRFDQEALFLEDRRDFIATCFKRSDSICVCTLKNGEMRAFGMLSKAVEGNRLLGPVYAVDSESIFLVVSSLLHTVRNQCPEDVIVAYVPEDSIGYKTLRSFGFDVTRPLKLWITYVSGLNYKVPREKIVAIGSVVFDAC